MKNSSLWLGLIVGGATLYALARKSAANTQSQVQASPPAPGYGNVIYVPPPSATSANPISVVGFSPLLSPEILRDIQDIYQNHGMDPSAFETEATFLHALGIHATGPLQASLFSAAKTLSDRAKQLRST